MTHLSAFALDQLALGALDADAAERAHTHLASCAACRSDAATAEVARAHFTAAVLPRFAPGARRRIAWPWLAAPAFAVVAAAAVVAVMLRGSAEHGDPGTLAIKGTAAWRVFANRDGETFPVHDGTELAAGDRVRFVVTPAGAGYVIIGSIDGSGAASIYYPYAGTSSAPVGGPRDELPGSIVLDDAPGPERLFAVFSDRPIAAAQVIARLRELGSRGDAAIRAARSLDVADATDQLTLRFEKRAPP